MVAPPPVRQEVPALTRCPVCGEPLPAAATWRLQRAVPGRLPGFTLTHKRQNGRTCTVIAGPAAPEGGRQVE